MSRSSDIRVKLSDVALGTYNTTGSIARSENKSFDLLIRSRSVRASQRRTHCTSCSLDLPDTVEDID